MTGILSLYTAPGSEPVGLDEIKAHLRVDDTASDGEIVGMMIAAREAVEAWTGRALVTQTLEWFLPCWPVDTYGGSLVLPRPPLVSVTHVKYIDTDGTEQTVSSSDYTVIAPAGPRAAPGIVAPAYAVVWPSARFQRDAIRVRYVAGYGGPEQVPDAIRSAIKLLVGDLHENREAQAEKALAANETLRNILLPFQTHIGALRAA